MWGDGNSACGVRRRLEGATAFERRWSYSECLLPDKVAVFSRSESLTFRQLQAEAAATAQVPLPGSISG